MTGPSAAGTAYPWAASQLRSASGSVDWSWTVSYGPTTAWEMTLTGPMPPLELLDAPNEPVVVDPGQYGGGPQLTWGALMMVWVSWPRFWKSASDERPTVATPLMGRTQANDEGSPL